MKCPRCKGRGRTHLDTTLFGFTCGLCKGKGYLTNDDWFCSLPVKEKAREMCVIMADMAEANDGVWDEKMIEAWLKEEHHE